MTITKDGIFVSDEHSSNLNSHPSIGHLVIDSLSDETLSKAVIFVDAASGREWTGAQLKVKILSVSAALIDLYDFKRGTCVCIDYDHTDQTVILALAVIFAGGFVACAFPKDPYAELLYLARKVGPKFLFCHKSNIHWAKRLTGDLGHEVQAIAMDDPTSEGKECFGKLFDYDDSITATREILPIACNDVGQDLAFVTMSSGTTGQPKAIPVTHSMIINDSFGSNKQQQPGGQYTMSFTASLDYVSGRLIMMGAIRVGYRAIIMNGFEPKQMLKAIEMYNINVMFLGAASFYNFMTHKELEHYNLKSLFSAFPMGAKITYLKELKDFLDRHSHIKFMNQGFGTSETCGIAVRKTSKDKFLADSDNCGKLLPDLQAKIVDAKTGKLLGPNKIGMIHVKGPTVFPGYYEISKLIDSDSVDQNSNINVNCKSSKFLRDSSTFDEDGFYITGDMAYFNDQEELYCVGRKKEMMSCRGAKKVLPDEIEVLLLGHPAVMKACVLGIPNKIEPTLQCPRAYIVLKPVCYDETTNELPLAHSPDSKPKEPLQYKGVNKLCNLPIMRQHKLSEDIMNFLNERIGWEKQLTGGLVLVDEMPTLRETGKINKCYLRSLSTDLVEIYGDQSE